MNPFSPTATVLLQGPVFSHLSLSLSSLLSKNSALLLELSKQGVRQEQGRQGVSPWIFHFYSWYWDCISNYLTCMQIDNKLVQLIGHKLLHDSLRCWCSHLSCHTEAPTKAALLGYGQRCEADDVWFLGSFSDTACTWQTGLLVTCAPVCNSS